MPPEQSVAAADAEPQWIPIAPSILAEPGARRALRACARRLSSVGSNGTAALTIAAIRAQETARAYEHETAVAQVLVLCLNILCDLRAQGWSLRVDRNGIAALAPVRDAGSLFDNKARTRAAHLIERDAQLCQPATRRFIREMERRRPHAGGRYSIFSLMRDGRELAEQLRAAGRLSADERLCALREVIDPYIQVITPRATCEHTGLRLADVWRYFRHTWTTTYQSTPGRKVFYLVRDRAAVNHPVIGIGALGSAIVQLSVRDEWIGWTKSEFIAAVREKPTVSWARWLERTLDSLIENIYVEDFLAEGLVSPGDLRHPSENVLARLVTLARDERHIHRLFPARGQHKHLSGSGGEPDWIQQACTHLFRSKRAIALAELLRARCFLHAAGFTAPTRQNLRKALSNRDAVRSIATVLRHAKAAHVGVDVMDITVCGAVAPYNVLLGGKLVSLLMTSPDATAAYNRRYRKASSVIASSMAGRSVRRAPHLVLLGTTSLYGVGSSQYNRLMMPAEFAGGRRGEQLAYYCLGRTVGYGSYHFSRETMAAIEPVLRRLQRGRPVNSIFGEGVNPKLRKVRSALDAVGLPADLLLQHGSPRLVYAIPLASNFRDILLGRSHRPQYILPNHGRTTARLVEYWRTRWLAHRIDRSEVLEKIMAHSLAYPVQHGARVRLPEVAGEAGPLFTPDDERACVAHDD